MVLCERRSIGNWDLPCLVVATPKRKTFHLDVFHRVAELSPTFLYPLKLFAFYEGRYCIYKLVASHLTDYDEPGNHLTFNCRPLSTAPRQVLELALLRRPVL